MPQWMMRRMLIDLRVIVLCLVDVECGVVMFVFCGLLVQSRKRNGKQPLFFSNLEEPASFTYTLSISCE